MKAAIGILTAFVFFLIAFASAQAGPCYPTEAVKKTMAEKHGEEPRHAGVSNGNLIVVYVSPQGSFTVVLQRPDGVSCLIDAGVAWTEKKGKGI